MKRRFNILSDPRFRLVYGERRRFREGFQPKKLRLNREQFNLLPEVKKKTPVYPGMLLAEHPSLEKGDLHAPVYGVVSDITVRSIFIEVQDAAQLDTSSFPPVPPVDLLGGDLRGEDLVLAVKKLGVNTRSLGRKVKTLVINGLNPEPGVTWAEAMLIEYGEELQAGIELNAASTVLTRSYSRCRRGRKYASAAYVPCMWSRNIPTAFPNCSSRK